MTNETIVASPGRARVLRVGIAAASAAMVLVPWQAISAAEERLRYLEYYGAASRYVLTVGVAALGCALLLLGLWALFDRRIAWPWLLAIAQAELLYLASALYWLAYVVATLSREREEQVLLPLLQPGSW